jgi:hypothetical protein
MSKWPMRGHFRYLRFKNFPMTPRTPQGEVFWALLSNPKHSGVPEDSKSPTLGVLGFTPTFGQSGVATHKLCELFFMQPPWMFIRPSISHDLLGVMQVAQHQWLFFTWPLLSYAIHASCMLVAFFSSSLLHTTLDMQIAHLFIFFLVGNWRDSLNTPSNLSCDHVNWARDAMIFNKAISMSMSSDLTSCIVFLQWCNNG